MLETLLSLLLALCLIWLFAIALQNLQPSNRKPQWHHPPKNTNDPRSLVITSLTKAPLPPPPRPNAVKKSLPPSQAKPLPPPKLQLQPPKTSSISSETKRRLLRLVNHDQRVADRLIEHAKQKYPNQSEQWIWDKVIFDLERDRH